VSTLAGNGGSTNVDGVGTNADFVYPVGVDISSDGLFAVVVCDSSIRRIVISTALVTTLAGRATAGSTDGGAPTLSSAVLWMERYLMSTALLC
jgi:hypothetical protein